MKPKVPLSFELFPPATLVGWKNLINTVETLKLRQPSFFSVTFGAGGSTQYRSLDLVKYLAQADITVVPHITCIDTNKVIIDQLLAEYNRLNINRLIVVRGDLPDQNAHFLDFSYASDLLTFIRGKNDPAFKMIVAAYPEFHPESTDPHADLFYLKEKVDAGAEAAITQYFFNPDAYYRYVEHCRQSGIHVPIIPGIMPIHNYEKLKRFSQKCQAEIPSWLDKRLQAYADKPHSLKRFGIDVVSRLCETLIDYGVSGLHFYTLNQHETTISILDNISNKVSPSLLPDLKMQGRFP